MSMRQQLQDSTEHSTKQQLGEGPPGPEWGAVFAEEAIAGIIGGRDVLVMAVTNKTVDELNTTRCSRMPGEPFVLVLHELATSLEKRTVPLLLAPVGALRVHPDEGRTVPASTTGAGESSWPGLF